MKLVQLTLTPDELALLGNILAYTGAVIKPGVPEETRMSILSQMVEGLAFVGVEGYNALALRIATLVSAQEDYTVVAHTDEKGRIV